MIWTCSAASALQTANARSRVDTKRRRPESRRRDGVSDRYLKLCLHPEPALRGWTVMMQVVAARVCSPHERKSDALSPICQEPTAATGEAVESVKGRFQELHRRQWDFVPNQLDHARRPVTEGRWRTWSADSIADARRKPLDDTNRL